MISHTPSSTPTQCKVRNNKKDIGLGMNKSEQASGGDEGGSAGVPSSVNDPASTVKRVFADFDETEAETRKVGSFLFHGVS